MWSIGMLTRGTKSREEESRLSESACPKKKGVSMTQNNRWKIKEVWRESEDPGGSCNFSERVKSSALSDGA